MIAKIGICVVLAAMMLLISTGTAYADATYTIKPGDCGLYAKYHEHLVFPKTTSLLVNLTWDNPAVKLVLTIHKPDGGIYGTYFPAGGHGTYKTQIALFINNSQGVEKGKWGYFINYAEGTAITQYRVRNYPA